MKLKQIALASALAVSCAAPAFAAINLDGDNAELWGLVWDEEFGTYAIDFGITVGQYEAGFTGVLGTVAGANWEAFVAADDGLNDFGAFEGTRWAIFATSNIAGFGGIPDSQYYYTTSFNDNAPNLLDSSFQATIDSMGEFGFPATLAQNGLTPDPAVQGDAFNAVGSDAHFLEIGFGGGFGLFAGNAIGSTQVLYKGTYGGFFDGTAQSVWSTKPLTTVSFDGQAFTVSAVPEPGTYALMLAGLMGVGFMARRRRG